MDLDLKNKRFVICGATSGFGRAITEKLIAEEAKVVAVARRAEMLQELSDKFPGQVTTICIDVTQDSSVKELLRLLGDKPLDGLLVNAGGPPAMTTLETKLEDWDKAYKSLLRWKVDLTNSIVPKMISQKFGRIVYIESAAVKQPIENLVLSNSLRLAVVGYVKTLSQEIANTGVTLNILAPGTHKTAAMDRIINKKIEQSGITREEAIEQFVKQTGVGSLGDPDDFASLAVWLFSAHSRFITGQTITVTGASIRGIMG